MEEGLKFDGESAKINLEGRVADLEKAAKYWLTLAAQHGSSVLDGYHAGRRDAASFMSYGVAKRISKNGDKFGTGELEGVLAPRPPRTRPAAARCCR